MKLQPGSRLRYTVGSEIITLEIVEIWFEVYWNMLLPKVRIRRAMTTGPNDVALLSEYVETAQGLFSELNLRQWEQVTP